MARFAWILAVLCVCVAAFAALRFVEQRRGQTEALADPPASPENEQSAANVEAAPPARLAQQPSEKQFEDLFSEQPDESPQPAAEVPQAAGEDTSSGTEGEQPRSFIGALRSAMSSMKEAFGEEHDELVGGLEEAEKQWERERREAKRLLRDGGRQPRADVEHSPNIILITADQVALGDFSCYGQQRYETPAIDAMAAEGVQFTHYYAGATRRAAAACALFTGWHSGHGRIRGRDAEGALKHHDTTVAEVLWRAGYRTHMVGYWTLGAPGTAGAPHKQGFERAVWRSISDEATPPIPETVWQNGEETRLADIDETLPGRTLLDWVTQRAEAFLDEQPLRGLPRRPFFLHVGYRLPRAEDGEEEDASGPLQRLHASSMETLDEHVGRLLERLRATEWRNSTIVFLTAWHAPQPSGPLAEHFNRAAGLRTEALPLAEGRLRVPVIVWNTRHSPSQGAVAETWAAWDFLPTAAQLVFATRVPRRIDGRSQIHLLDERYPEPEEDRYFYWETGEPSAAQAVLVDRWKAVRTGGRAEPSQLFDLQSDPREQQNVAERHQAVVTELEKVLDDFARPAGQ